MSEAAPLHRLIEHSEPRRHGFDTEGVGGENCDHVGMGLRVGNVYRSQAGVGHHAANKGDMQSIGRGQVIDVHPSDGEEIGVLDAGHPGANHAHGGELYIRGSSVCRTTPRPVRGFRCGTSR